MKNDLKFPVPAAPDATVPAIPVSPAVAAIIAKTADKARQVRRRSKAPNTLRAYGADLANLKTWCQSHGLEAAPMPMPPDLAAAYLVEQYEAGSTIATVKHRASALAWAHRDKGFTSPCDSGVVRATLEGLASIDKEERRDNRRPGPKRADGLRMSTATKIAARVEAKGASVTKRELRDLAIVLVARDTMARASEVASLMIEMIGTTEGGATSIKFGRIKTGGEARPRPLGADTADALAAWLKAARISSGPLFRAIGKGSKGQEGPVKEKGIGVRDVNRAVKSLAGQGYSSHSMRRGMAEDLVANHAELPEVMGTGDWKSPEMVITYTQDIDADDSPVLQFHKDWARKHK